MKRLLHAAGAAAAAAALCLTTATSAGAATGTLVLNLKRIANPQGCYNSDRTPMLVNNLTDQFVTVFDGANCTGDPIDVMSPGSSTLSEFGHSVYVP